MNGGMLIDLSGYQHFTQVCFNQDYVGPQLQGVCGRKGQNSSFTAVA